MNAQIKTQININAPVSQVWQTLTDFISYPHWNPFIKEIKGDVAVGNTITAVLPGMTFTPTVLKLDADKEFRWKGVLWFKNLFTGEHYFQLQDTGDGTTTFIHGEHFTGILVKLLPAKFEQQTIDGFKTMNEALKVRVEGV